MVLWPSELHRKESPGPILGPVVDMFAKQLVYTK